MLEKNACDFSKPLQLFSGYINLGLTERMNLVERQTVHLFRSKYVEPKHDATQMSKHKTLSMGGTDSTEEMLEDNEDPKIIELEKEKIQLEDKILAL